MECHDPTQHAHTQADAAKKSTLTELPWRCSVHEKSQEYITNSTGSSNSKVISRPSGGRALSRLKRPRAAPPSPVTPENRPDPLRDGKRN